MSHISSQFAALGTSVARWRPSYTLLTALLAGYFSLFANHALFAALHTVYPMAGSVSDLAVWMAVGAVLYAVTLLCLTALLWPAWFRVGTTLLALATAAAAWAMDNWHVILHPDLLRSVFATDRSEVRDLLDPSLVAQLTVVALPAIACVSLWQPQPHPSAGSLLRAKFVLVALAVVLIGGVFAASPRGVVAFVREHKEVRELANPAMYLYSTARLLMSASEHPIGPSRRQVIGTDAHVGHTSQDARLVVLVVGETARPDHMSIYGYRRPTTPALARLPIVALTDVEACGTSTAVSVPCMFSDLPRRGHDVTDFHDRENLLDVLEHAGIDVLWRDNNSDSKGVATEVPHEDFRTPARNPDCDSECRDIGMLSGLDAYIDAHAGRDLLIVLHQRGSHGPAYWHRVPDDARTFAPGCRTSELQRCTPAEIVNSYDDTILQTDRFLAGAIALLERRTDRPYRALVYIGDHGESLGEHGWYLHGLPRALAPREQLAVPWLFWLGPGLANLREQLEARRTAPVSHDHLFHAMLRVMDVETKLYDPALDPFGARSP